MELGLSGKTAVVTGGSSGLGSAVCEAFSAEGANVLLGYLSHELEARRLAATYSVTVIPVRVDVREAEEIDAMFAAAVENFGGFDILVNNAGTWPLRKVVDIGDEEWEETIRVNLTSGFLTSKRAATYFLREMRAGRIINIVSINAFQGSTQGHAHYAAAKGGLLSFTFSLAREVAPYGITVNAVCPGMMRTPMNEAVLAEHEEDYVSRIPLRRISTPGEVASSVVFLASEKASYITGSTLNVSGGMVMR